MTNDTHPNIFEVESKRAYVVYHPQSGAIVHVHKVTTFRGANQLSQVDEEKRAIALAKQVGHAVEGLQVMRVEPDDLDHNMAQYVDLKNQRLIEDARRPSSS